MEKRILVVFFTFILQMILETRCEAQVFPSIQIHESQKTSIQDRLVHGYNTEGMMSQVSWDFSMPDTIEAFALIDALKAQVLRYPGGGRTKFAHTMFDENGNPSVGYGYRRAEIDAYFLANPQGSDEDSYQDWLRRLDEQDKINYRYVDRFVDLINHFTIKPKVIYVMNVYLASLDEEMAAIRYLVNNGVDVVAVEMGNESYALFNDADAFWAKASPFLNQMKLEFPNIKRSVPVAKPLGPGSFKTQWNTRLATLMNENPGLINGIVPHYYGIISDECSALYDSYLTPKANYEIPFLTKDPVLGSFFDCAKPMVKGFEDSDFPQNISDLQGVFGSGVEMYMTEWNMKPLQLGNTYLDALHAFRFFHELIDRPEFKYVGHHNLLAPYFHAIIATKMSADQTDNEYVARTKYYAFLLNNKIQDGYDKVDMDFTPTSDDLFARAYINDNQNKVLVYVANSSDSEYQWDSSVLTLDDKNVSGCTIEGVDAKQLYSSAGATDYFMKNTFYKNNPPEIEINGIKTFDRVPARSIAAVECSVVPKPQPTPTPTPTPSPTVTPPPTDNQPWYCKWFPQKKGCKK